MVLDVTVEHGLPELHVGPHHVLLDTAVGKLGDTCSQFLPNRDTEACLGQRHVTVTRRKGGGVKLTLQKAVMRGSRVDAMPCSSICEQSCTDTEAVRPGSVPGSKAFWFKIPPVSRQGRLALPV